MPTSAEGQLTRPAPIRFPSPPTPSSVVRMGSFGFATISRSTPSHLERPRSSTPPPSASQILPVLRPLLWTRRGGSSMSPGASASHKGFPQLRTPFSPPSIPKIRSLVPRHPRPARRWQRVLALFHVPRQRRRDSIRCVRRCRGQGPHRRYWRGPSRHGRLISIYRGRLRGYRQPSYPLRRAHAPPASNAHADANSNA